ncbi:MAG TPA: AraC family transcriptional regulator [Pseudomonadales bacterium]|jgi:AraC-like DNA-binding protein|nr:AraC family transcriptional regulator [Pseudomonadales bacterium]
MNDLSVRVRPSTLPSLAPESGNVTVVGGYVAAIIRALEARGVAIETILQACGIPRVPSNDPLTRIPLTSVRRLLAAAVDLTNDPYIGLYAANFLHAANLHALGYALQASGSLREFCERLARYFRLLSGNSRPELNVSAHEARLEFPLVTESPPLTDDVFGLFLVHLIAELSDGTIRPIRVEQHRPAPPDDGVRHRRAFGCPVSFGAPHTLLIFRAEALDLPLTGASRELAEQNERIVVAYLAKLDRGDIQNRVRAILLQQLPSGTATKEGVAGKLCMSPRTLQVKLSKSGTTFQDVVNETRQALACGYMDNSGLSITEIAYLLGFSDTSNFSRAFRRWTGRSPRAYLARS